MKLTLTDNEGLVLGEYSIGGKREFDIEDLDAMPEHDVYLEDGEQIDLNDVVKRDILILAKQGYK